MILNVVDVFDSMQGEGYWMGVYCTFIRLPGCNYKCPFCDTDFSKANVEFDTDTAKLQHHVVITGGEPSIHPCIQDLITELHERGCFVHVETNGTNIHALRGADWITCSPKPHKYLKGQQEPDWMNYIGQIHEFKQVVSSDWDVTFWTQLASLNKLLIWLQPCDGLDIQESIQQISQLIQEYPDIFRAGIQLHKYYGVD